MEAVGISGDRFEQTVEHAHLDAAVVASLGRLVGTEPILGKIAPTRP